MSNTPIVSRGGLSPGAGRILIGVMAGLLVMGTSSAQYAFDPSNPDEHDLPGIRYFGSVKDSAGKVVPGATIVVTDPNTTFIFATDHDGRFRGVVPEDTDTSQVQLKCFKTGYEQVRVTKRPGAGNAKPTVQVDCLLRPAVAS